jgi:chemotaxis protein MotB
MKSYGFTLLIALLYSVVGVKAETPPVTALSDGIAAFICDEIDHKKNVPMIFIKDGNNWNSSGSTELSVNKIENGFKLKSLGDEEGFGFLKKISGTQWNFEYLDQKGFYETSCKPQDYFVDLLIKHIGPKIIDNGNLLANEILDLNKALAQAINTADLRAKKISLLSEVLSETEKKRLAEAATAGFLREKLKNDNTELTAMSLALEAERKEAEITLTKIAAANALEKSLKIDLSKSFTEVERQAALIAEANSLLEKEKDISSSAQRKLALLNTQTSQLRNQLNELQGLLDESKEADTKAQIQLKSLGSDLNLALARVAAEQRKIAELEAKEKLRYAEEAKDLRNFRSQFFGELRKVMEGQEGVRIVGDRFVFSSDVLFSVGSANLGSLAKTEIDKVAKIIKEIADEIPPNIDWILRVDGHTDRIPFKGLGKDYKDNWELSQARALSVVRYLMDDLKIPANRLAANGFGEFQPIDNRDTPEAYKTNRRIELKFTEK